MLYCLEQWFLTGETSPGPKGRQ